MQRRGETSQMHRGKMAMFNCNDGAMLVMLRRVVECVFNQYICMGHNDGGCDTCLTSYQWDFALTVPECHKAKSGQDNHRQFVPCKIGDIT
jgi:hypothetical protein